MSDTIETDHLRIPKLGLGTWPMKGKDCQAAVESALAMGYRALDTAEMYGNEDAVGAAIHASGVPREEIFVTSKVWHANLTPDGIRAACEASLNRLNLYAIDLYLIHWPSPGMDLPACLDAMVGLKEEGMARAIGVANFPAGLLRRALETGAPIAVNQVEYHVGLSQYDMLQVARAAGVVVTAYSPLGRGAMTRDPEVARIAGRLDVTPAQVLLAWLLRQDGVTAIPKSARAEGQQENLGALAVVDLLEAEDLRVLDALPKDQRLVNPEFAPDWAD